MSAAPVALPPPAVPGSMRGDVSDWPTEVVEAELCRWAANQTAAEARFLALVAEYDRREGWRSWGCVSCAAWLAWHTGLDIRAAREKVRVARVLAEHPVLADAMATGRLSYAKVRALSRIVTPTNEAALVDIGLAGTSNQVERLVTAYRRCQPSEAAAEQLAHDGRGVWVRHHDATTEVTVRLPTEAAACLLAAIDTFRRDHPDPALGATDSFAARRADALTSLAEHAVATLDAPGTDDTRYLATIHLTPDAVDEPVDHPAGASVCAVSPGDGLDHDPVAVPISTARRLLCDAALEAVAHTDATLRYGRRRRIVPPRLRRALRLRDTTCRFPSCTRRSHLDAHHNHHWLDLGRTEPENLTSLCRHHHRLVHEGGWRISGNPNDTLTFIAPDGSRHPEHPPRTTGNAIVVDALGRTADDGRCHWTGEPLDLGYTTSVLLGNELLATALATA